MTPTSRVPVWGDYIGELLNQGNFAEIYAVKNEPGLVARVWRDRDDSDDGWENDCLKADLQAQIFYKIGPFVPKVVGKLLLKNRWGEDRMVVFMEYAGRDLGDRLERMSLKEICQVASKVLEGLARLHQAGLVHLDIKSRNLTDKGIILDWDFCSKVKKGATIICGTWIYKAPEISNHRRCSEKADIWSLGVTLHEQLSGPRFWAGMFNRTKERLERQIADERSYLEKNPQELRFFDKVIVPMLEFDSKKRVSAEGALANLKQFLDEERS
jgi:serine/threonine protein kinase